MKNIIIIELEKYHHEIVYCHLISNINIKKNIFIYCNYISDYYIENKYKITFKKLIFSIIKDEYEYIFNTIEKPLQAILFIILKIFKKDVSITIHNPDVFINTGNKVKFKKMLYRFVFSKYILNKTNNIYLLSDRTTKILKNYNFNNKIKLLNTNVLNNLVKNVNINRQNEIGIIGSVDFKRRKYYEILNQIKYLAIKGYKIKLIGNINELDGVTIKNYINKNHLETYIKYFDYKLDYGEFYEEIFKCNYILCAFNDLRYIDEKISFSEIIAKAFNIPIIFYENNYFKIYGNKYKSLGDIIK